MKAQFSWDDIEGYDLMHKDEYADHSWPYETDYAIIITHIEESTQTPAGNTTTEICVDREYEVHIGNLIKEDEAGKYEVEEITFEEL